MYCIEFRRQKLAVPDRLTAEQAEHIARCPHCAAFARSMARLERNLQAALRVPVPDGLADRVLLAQNMASRRRFGGLALAAALLLTAGVSLVQLRESPLGAVGRRMIAHVLSEPWAIGIEDSIPPERIAAALASVGATPGIAIGRVSFLDNCRGLDPGGTHVVAHTPYGRVAILLLPNTAGDGAAAVRVAHQGLVAAVFRAPRGVVSVVADSAAKAGSVEQLFRRTAGWDG